MDFRVTVVFDYTVPDDTDPDEFHDHLRDMLEEGSLESVWDYKLDTVRDIEVTVL